MIGQPDGFIYKPNFLTFSQQVALLQKLRGLHYEHDVFHGRLMKRGWAQFGHSYVSAKRKVTPAPAMPTYLQTILQNARVYYPDDLTFTQCIVTKYVPSAGIGWHSDAAVFGSYILGLSLASEARLQFRPKKTQKATFEVKVAPGSLYVMHGSARYDYDHRIVPVKTERFSLTFRYLAQEEPVRSFAPRHEAKFPSLTA
jgi:alkylated DNA repair protein (DNA oxidative demethylase)